MLRADAITVDNFAGGGGASLGIGFIEWRAHAQLKRAVRIAARFGLISAAEAERRLAYSRRRYDIFKRQLTGRQEVQT